MDYVASNYKMIYESRSAQSWPVLKLHSSICLHGLEKNGNTTPVRLADVWAEFELGTCKIFVTFRDVMLLVHAVSIHAPTSDPWSSAHSEGQTLFLIEWLEFRPPQTSPITSLGFSNVHRVVRNLFHTSVMRVAYIQLQVKVSELLHMWTRTKGSRAISPFHILIQFTSWLITKSNFIFTFTLISLFYCEGWKNLAERKYSEDLGVDVKIILDWIFVKMWIGFIWVRRRTNGDPV